MAKEARGGAAIQLTPDETRIIEERIIAAAAERELEHYLINEVTVISTSHVVMCGEEEMQFFFNVNSR